MPGATPFRLYPYPVPTDATDVAQDIEDLAQAVNTDMEALALRVSGRPVARARGITPVTHVGPGTTTLPLPLEVIDFNQNGAIAPLTSGGIEILQEGFYFIIATAIYRSNGPGSQVDRVHVAVLDSAGAGMAENSIHQTIFIAEGSRQMDLGGSVVIDPSTGANTLRMESIVGRAAGSDSFTFLDRTLTVLRMTES